jgi:hypothetical protein
VNQVRVGQLWCRTDKDGTQHLFEITGIAKYHPFRICGTYMNTRRPVANVTLGRLQRGECGLTLVQDCEEREAFIPPPSKVREAKRHTRIFYPSGMNRKSVEREIAPYLNMGTEEISDITGISQEVIRHVMGGM